MNLTKQGTLHSLFYRSALLILSATIGVGCQNKEAENTKYQAEKPQQNEAEKEPPKQQITSPSPEQPETVAPSGVDENVANPRKTQQTTEPKKDLNETTESTLKKEGQNSSDSTSKAVAEKNTTDKTENEPAPETDRWTVPVDGINSVLVFLDELTQQSAKLARDPVKNRIELIQIQRARILAAEEVMDHKELKSRAIRVKLESLITMSQLGEPNAQELAKEFSESMIDSPDPKVVEMGRFFLFNDQFQKAITSGDKEKIDALLIAIEELIDQQPDNYNVFTATYKVVIELRKKNHHDTALQGLKSITTAFEHSKTPKIVASLANLRDQTFLWEKKFDLVAKEMWKDPNEKNTKNFIETAKVVLKHPKPSQIIFGEIIRPTMYIEGKHQYEEATEIYKLLKSTYAKVEDAKLSSSALLICDKSIRRLGLVGTKLEVEGVILASKKPMDWSLFKEKVVILTFWQSGSAPSSQTLKHLSEFAKANKEKNIKLLTVNIDKDPQATVRQFRGRIPDWTILLTPDLNKTGFATPLAEKCAIITAPYTMLLAPGGKVAYLNPSGTALEQKVADLLNEEVKGHDVNGKEVILKPSKNTENNK